MIRWLRSSAAYLRQRPSHAAVVATALATGFAVGAPLGDAGYQYTWRNDRFCGDCHVHPYANENFDRSVHAGVTTCHDCHKVPLSHYPYELWLMVAGPPRTPEEFGPVHVPSVLCDACHLKASTEPLTGPMTATFRRQVVKVDDSPLHALHLGATTRQPRPYLGAGFHAPATHGEDHPHGLEDETRTISCMDCHGSGGDLATHRFTASRDNCVRCHSEIDVATGRLAALPCQTCHLTGFVGTREVDAP